MRWGKGAILTTLAVLYSFFEQHCLRLSYSSIWNNFLGLILLCNEIVIKSRLVLYCYSHPSLPLSLSSLSQRIRRWFKGWGDFDIQFPFNPYASDVAHKIRSEPDAISNQACGSLQYDNCSADVTLRPLRLCDSIPINGHGEAQEQFFYDRIVKKWNHRTGARTIRSLGCAIVSTLRLKNVFCILLLNRGTNPSAPPSWVLLLFVFNTRAQCHIAKRSGKVIVIAKRSKASDLLHFWITKFEDKLLSSFPLHNICIFLERQPI